MGISPGNPTDVMCGEVNAYLFRCVDQKEALSRHGRNHLGQKKMRWDGIFGTAVRMWPCLGRHCVTLTVAGQLLLRLRNLLALPGNRRNKHVSKCGCRDKRRDKADTPGLFIMVMMMMISGHRSHKWTENIGIQYRQLSIT